jgi:hypothetical protein
MSYSPTSRAIEDKALVALLGLIGLPFGCENTKSVGAAGILKFL